ncbi:SpoIIE family protein phosphatase [Streptacidiphilus sp. 4-A2]|nr:SpoIIE family protein phosphatase [Streptacidiphilus sp. 4-A2]
MPFQSVDLTVPEGTLLLLYTDGLVESRTADIDVGTQRLIDIFNQPFDSIEDACERIVDTLERGQEPDDVALLLARLGSAEPSAGARSASWTLAADPSAPGRARRLVRSTLSEWGCWNCPTSPSCWSASLSRMRSGTRRHRSGYDCSRTGCCWWRCPTRCPTRPSSGRRRAPTRADAAWSWCTGSPTAGGRGWRSRARWSGSSRACRAPLPPGPAEPAPPVGRSGRRAPPVGGSGRPPSRSGRLRRRVPIPAGGDRLPGAARAVDAVRPPGVVRGLAGTGATGATGGTDGAAAAADAPGVARCGCGPRPGLLKRK